MPLCLHLILNFSLLEKGWSRFNLGTIRNIRKNLLSVFKVFRLPDLRKISRKLSHTSRGIIRIKVRELGWENEVLQ